MSALARVIEKFIYHFQSNKEHYNNPSNYEINVDAKNQFSASMLSLLVSYFLIYIILLFLGKWIWNNHAVNMINILNPIDSIIPLVGLSILVKLLIFV